MRTLGGVIPAITTPFDAAGEIDDGKFRRQIHFMLGKGVHGLCFAGSTGEGHTLDIDEFRRLTQITVEETQGRVPVVAGIIANSTRDAIQRGRAIADLAVDALQITPVHYVFTPDDESNLQHFKTICDALQRPVLLYNVVPGNLLSTPLVLRLLNEVPLVVGIKQSQGHITRVAELVANAPKDKVILAAVDNLLYSCFSFGAHGTLAASPTGVPGPIVRLWDAVKAGDHAKAHEIHRALLRFWNVIVGDNLPANVKTALALQGVATGSPRAPMPASSPAQQAAIRRELDNVLRFDS